MKLLYLLLWLLASPALAQEALVLRGLVLDADTHQPLPFAQVGIAGNKLGTSTNQEGRFALRVPAAYATTELEVALLGYRRYTRPLPPLPAPELRIELQSSPATLGAVAVSSSVTGIIREAVARIPRNYSTRPTRLTGFFRESDDHGAGHAYDYLSEGVLLVYKAPYQHPNDDGQVQILEARKVDLRDTLHSAPGLLQIEWSAGPFVPHRFDFVHNRAEFIQPFQFKNYQYQLTPQTTFQGRPVYVIAFGPRPGTDRANFAGELYIDEQSYAFLGAAWHRTPSGIRREHVLSFRATERAYRVAYQQYAGRWHLKSIWYNTLGSPVAGQARRHLAEFQTTAIDTAQAAPIPYPERAQYNDIFLRAPTPYDSTFWKNYTTLLPASQLQLDLLDQARQQQAEQLLAAPAPVVTEAAPSPAVTSLPARRWWQGRLRYTYGLGLLPVAAAESALGVDIAPPGSAFRAMATTEVRRRRVAASYQLGVQIELPRHLALYGLTRHALGQLAGDGWEAGLSWERHLNPRGRPVLGRLGVAYLRQSLSRDLGTFDNPDASLRLAGAELATDRLALSLQRLTDAIQPKMGLGVELSHQWQAVADLGYLWPVRTRTQLLATEQGGFFHSDSEGTLNLPASEVQLTVDGQPAMAAPWQLGRWQLSVGLLYRLGK
ncbi:carboxypeptidase-like regulatory domain-containing protein [Hymenobacter setariae]|uniref:Carboxypeptidase-like regulatory domain-containing protein n=1 Tax=Hymenobacter setariae TaxID=2594794 RepID=A0A558BVN2_9BACT|nr:carboxypeptidase-like regulatory domain-containing protein [Hymenobacter setariae]TVT40580.1 carboxypeptidase-like regulatory domain-containing protein [Hymenobacter setariae]